MAWFSGFIAGSSLVLVVWFLRWALTYSAAHKRAQCAWNRGAFRYQEVLIKRVEEYHNDCLAVSTHGTIPQVLGVADHRADAADVVLRLVRETSIPRPNIEECEPPK